MEAAEKISITLTPEMLRRVRECLDSGEFASTSEVMRDALRIWLRERDEHPWHIEQIKRKLRDSMEDPPPNVSADEAFAEVARRMAKNRAKNDAAA